MCTHDGTTTTDCSQDSVPGFTIRIGMASRHGLQISCMLSQIASINIDSEGDVYLEGNERFDPYYSRPLKLQAKYCIITRT